MIYERCTLTTPVRCTLWEMHTYEMGDRGGVPGEWLKEQAKRPCCWWKYIVTIVLLFALYDIKFEKNTKKMSQIRQFQIYYLRKILISSFYHIKGFLNGLGGWGHTMSRGATS
jgi:hypothetical protein